MKYKYDAFICHASEDKDTFVRDLARELLSINIEIWYDEFTLTVGDSLFGKINQGLTESKYGIVIFSEAFFGKKWPKRELEGLVALEDDGEKKILPVWFDVDRDDILKHYPTLADLYAADASRGMSNVVTELSKVLRPRTRAEVPAHVSPTVFFHNRMIDAFPGKKGLYETVEKSEIMLRLPVLFRDPLRFPDYYSPLMVFDMHGGTADIDSFKVLDVDHILLDSEELNCRRLAAYRSLSYWQCFLYLESDPDPPTGLYQGSTEGEEYALYRGELMTRAEYDDGCMLREGKFIETTGSELRIRHLVPASLVIASRSSPINCNAFDAERSSILEGTISGQKSLADLVDAVKKLPRHPNDARSLP